MAKTTFFFLRTGFIHEHQCIQDRNVCKPSLSQSSDMFNPLNFLSSLHSESHNFLNILALGLFCVGVVFLKWKPFGVHNMY